MKEVWIAARRLRQSPGFTAIAILTLALGIGVNTAIFSMVDALLFRPLPFPQPDRVVRVVEHLNGFGEVGTSYPNFLDWQREARTVSAASVARQKDYTLTGRASSERIPVIEASHGFFDVLGVQPSIGRGLEPQQDVKGGASQVVLTDRLWRRRFAADPKLVGKTITMQGRNFTVLGVMPPTFNFPFINFDAIVNVGPQADFDRTSHSGTSVARLRPGVTTAQANAELKAIAGRIAGSNSKMGDGWTIETEPLRQVFVKDYRAVMTTMLGGVALVLLIACVNLAGLMLVRATARRRELALRKALGAGPLALVWEGLAEALLLGAAGGVLGVLLGSWCLRVLLALMPPELPVPVISLDARVLLFSILSTCISVCFFGLVPAMRTVRVDPVEDLKDAGRANTGGAAANRFRGGLVVAEIGLALLLAMAAGLVAKSFGNLLAVDPGFQSGGVLTMRVALSGPRYSDNAEVLFWDRFLHSLGTNPAIGKVGLVNFLPMSENDTETSYAVQGRPRPGNYSGTPFADTFLVGGDYLGAMGIALVRGRGLLPSDDQRAPLVTLIDEEFARKNFPDDDPLRHRLQWNDKTLSIVGVVRHVHAFGLDGAQMREQLYIPYAQYPFSSMTVTVRPASSNATAAAVVRDAVRAIDADVPVYEVRPMTDVINDHTWPARLGTILLAMFAALALLLAALGIYGVMANSVALRTQEIGIRLALGATPSAVLRMILRQAFLLSALGILMGMAAAFPAMGLLRTILFGVSPTDAGVFSVAALMVAAIGFAAGTIPAWHAARTDPMVAMRYE